MKSIFKCIVMLLGLLIAIFLNAIWWGSHPDTAVNFSNPLWQGLYRLYGTKNASQEMDLAFWVYTAVIILGSAVMTLVWRRAIRKVRHSKRRHGL